jgi:hypothetical protein
MNGQAGYPYQMICCDLHGSGKLGDRRGVLYKPSNDYRETIDSPGGPASRFKVVQDGAREHGPTRSAVGSKRPATPVSHVPKRARGAVSYRISKAHIRRVVDALHNHVDPDLRVA